jgi:hypothetical protein
MPSAPASIAAEKNVVPAGPRRLQRELLRHRRQHDDRQQQRKYLDVPACDSAICSRPTTSAIRGGDSLTPQ